MIDRQLGGEQLIVTQRDFLHVNLHTNDRFPRPLVGETPLSAACGDMARFKDQQQ